MHRCDYRKSGSQRFLQSRGWHTSKIENICVFFSVFFSGVTIDLDFLYGKKISDYLMRSFSLSGLRERKKKERERADKKGYTRKGIYKIERCERNVERGGPRIERAAGTPLGPRSRTALIAGPTGTVHSRSFGLRKRERRSI